MTRPKSSNPQINKFFIGPDFSVAYRNTKNLQWQPPVVSDFAVLGVLSGQLDCLVNNDRVSITAATALIIDPNISIEATGKLVEFVFINLSSALVLDHAQSMRLIAPKSTVTFKHELLVADRKLVQQLRNMVSELVNEEAGKDIVMRALVEQQIVHILRNYSTSRRSDELELSRVGLVDRRIRRSVELMHAQLDQELSLNTLAAASYLSTFHFARLFKKLTGTTPHNYLAAVRTKRAQRLLADTELSITEVGSRVGYLSASHFTKAFRLATGTTPREFRKALIPR